jgi:orotidine-5'-phosphate decarboxylase
MSAAQLYCALDTVSLLQAQSWARSLSGHVDGVKLGLEFFVANGPAGVRAIQAEGVSIFLDLKLHDIPNTVAGGMRAAAALGVAFVTVHTMGGPAMLQAAKAASIEGAGKQAPPRVIGITVMTSLGEEDLAATGQHGPLGSQALRLAELASESRLDGVVCSAREAAALRAKLDSSMLLVTPGIRPRGGDTQDQKRVVTPGDAVRLGANLLVVGRPITESPDPGEAARLIRAEMTAAQGQTA